MGRRACLFVLALVLSVPSAALAAGAPASPQAQTPAVKVLDDFEGPRINWTGTYRGSIVSQYATHGKNAFKVTFPAGVQYPGITASDIDLDWGGYDALKIDVYNPEPEPVQIGIRIDDPQSAGYSTRYNGEILLLNGQTRLEIPFSDIAASGRPLDYAHIKVFTIFMSSPPKDVTLFLDNIRVATGAEGPGTMGREFPSGAASPEVQALRDKAVEARNRLDALVNLAHKQGFGTLEANIALITANLGLEVRPSLKWFANRKGELYEYARQSCDEAYEGLKDTLEGRRAVAPVPPVYGASALAVAGAYFAEKPRPSSKPPVPLFSMLYVSEGPLCEYFMPADFWVHSHAFPGASRYDVERTPLWKAYHEFPDTHRVWNGDEGWCGHVVRDSASMGGGKEPVVVCLESPHTKAAIDEYIKANAPKWKNNPRVLVNIMGGELSYICYCDYTLDMFRKYLQSGYGSIGRLNETWGVDFKSFDDVKVMPNASQAGENRARWYDWQAFNCWRFVEHAKWAKSKVREASADVPVSVGAVTYSFRADLGRSGVDEENLIRQVEDVVSNESGPSTITTDLLLSLSEGTKPIFDCEYHGDIAGILPHFLHGNAASAMWWWPDRPDTEFPQFNETALPFSWNIPLSDVAECLKIALDVRRIGPEIAAFSRRGADVAILYSRASLLQVAPEFLAGADTPYTIELKNAYDAALGLDAPVRFISTIQVREGKLSSCKLLVVPAAEYVFDDEVAAILEFVQNGGTAVITPNSWMCDQYARPRDHLEKLGLKISSVDVPKYGSGGLKRDDFLQGMVRETTAGGIPRTAVTFKSPAPAAGSSNPLLPDGTTLNGAGVFQHVVPPDAARVIAAAADGSPAVLDMPYGKGRIYYLAIPLVPESMNAFLDAAASAAGVDRPVRFGLASGGRDWQIEGRAFTRGRTTLFYIANHSAEARAVSVSLPAASELLDLRDPWREADPAKIEIGAKRTGIFAARPKGGVK